MATGWVLEGEVIIEKEMREQLYKENCKVLNREIRECCRIDMQGHVQERRNAEERNKDSGKIWGRKNRRGKG